MAIGWGSADCLLQLLGAAQNTCTNVTWLAPLEARVLAHLGLVRDTLMLRKEYAARYYRQAMEVSMNLRPLPTGEPWFWSLQRRMLVLQIQVSFGAVFGLWPDTGLLLLDVRAQAHTGDISVGGLQRIF